MKLLLLALLFGRNLLGTPVMVNEEPPFTVKFVQGEFEIRDYPALVAAEVTAPVTQAAATSEKIAMMAPVLQTGGNGSRVIRFIMPHGSTLETLLRPNNLQVRLVAVPAARMAVVKFSGLARQDDVNAKTAALSRYAKAQHLQATVAPSLAQYDPPWTLWFIRRSEVMIPVSH